MIQPNRRQILTIFAPGTVKLNGVEYYRARIEDADGKRVALYRMYISGYLLFLVHIDDIAGIFDFSGKNVVIIVLLPVNVVYVLL